MLRSSAGFTTAAKKQLNVFSLTQKKNTQWDLHISVAWLASLTGSGLSLLPWILKSMYCIGGYTVFSCISCLFFGFRFPRCLLFNKPSFFFYERWLFRQAGAPWWKPRRICYIFCLFWSCQSWQSWQWLGFIISSWSRSNWSASLIVNIVNRFFIISCHHVPAILKIRH